MVLSLVPVASLLAGSLGLLHAAASCSGQRPWLRDALAGAAYVLTAVLFTGTWSDLGTRFLAGNDPTQDAWVLATVTRNLLENPSRPFDSNVFYPSYGSVLYADPLLGPALLVLPLRFLTANPVLLYNAALVFCLALASFGFYRLGLRLFADTGAALLAGLVVPYSAQQMHHMFLGHIGYLSISGFPFLLLALVSLLERPGLGPAMATALAFAWQAGTYGYYAFCSALLCLVAAAWGWRRFRRPRTWAFCLLAAAAAAVLLAPYVTGFVGLKAESEMSRGPEWALGYSADLGSSFLRSNSLLWRRLLVHRINDRGGPLFPGLLVAVLAGLAFRRGGGPYLGLLKLVIVVFLPLSFGPRLHVWGRDMGPMPFQWLRDHVPLVDAMRHPVTFAVPVQMALGLAAVGGLAALGVSRRPWRITAVLAAAMAETLVPTPERRDRGAQLPDVYVFLEQQPPGALFELPLEAGVEHQWWSIQHRLPMIQGDMPFEPSRFGQLHRLVGREWGRQPAHQDMEGWASVRYLKTHFPVRYLVLHAGTSGYIASNVEATRRTFEPLHVTPAGDRVYRIRAGGTGAFLRRRFRGDQLSSHLITGRLRGDGVEVSASLNGTLLRRQRLGNGWETVTWALPPERIVPVVNVLDLTGWDGTDAAAFELEDCGP